MGSGRKLPDEDEYAKFRQRRLESVVTYLVHKPKHKEAVSEPSGCARYLPLSTVHDLPNNAHL